MNFQQLQVVHETARHGYRIRDVAGALSFSQNNVRKHIKDFEAELGLPVFERRGRGIAGLTAAGRDLIAVVDRIQGDIQRLKTIKGPGIQSPEETLRIGSTYTEARYVLPHVIRAFQTLFPNVRLQLHCGSHEEILKLLVGEAVDLGILRESEEPQPELMILKKLDWPLVLLLPERHPLTRMGQLTLEALAAFPLITYHQGVQGRRKIDSVFAAAGLAPEIVLAAGSDDIIVTYVGLGLGVGILAPMAFDPQNDQGLRILDASPIFGRMATRLCFRRGHALKKYVYQALELLTPQEVLSQLNTGA